MSRPGAGGNLVHQHSDGGSAPHQGKSSAIASLRECMIECDSQGDRAGNGALSDLLGQRADLLTVESHRAPLPGTEMHHLGGAVPHHSGRFSPLEEE